MKRISLSVIAATNLAICIAGLPTQALAQAVVAKSSGARHLPIPGSAQDRAEKTRQELERLRKEAEEARDSKGARDFSAALFGADSGAGDRKGGATTGATNAPRSAAAVSPCGGPGQPCNSTRPVPLKKIATKG
jgi:hypothetical protein